MGGGLMQLVAYGAQDIYLTGNPQITFFKVVYRRHTNFSMESIQQTWEGTYGEGARQTATLSRNGDLIYKMYIQRRCSVGGAAARTDFNLSNPGYNQMNSIELEIGGQKIDRHTGGFMSNYVELTEPNTCRQSSLSNVDISEVGGGDGTHTKFQAMALAGGFRNNPILQGGGLRGNALGGIRPNNTVYQTPLLFWFCRNPGLALPLIALQYHEVKVIVNWTNLATGAFHTAAMVGTNLAPELWCDYIYLDTDERRRFAQVSHEYLIEQVQHQSRGEQTTTLNFNHPVKEIIWTGTIDPGGAADADRTRGNPGTVGAAGVTWQLKLNGHDRFAPRTVPYFTRQQVYDHHTGYGSVTVPDSIAVYSFALKPEEHQPSGTCNFSRIDNAELISSVPIATEVYAINYNVLRIMSGMGGLAYSN